MENVLEVSGLSKAYKGQTVLNNLDLIVPNRGEIIQLKGQNGSGKSTLFKIIAGLEEPSSGVVTKQQNVKLGALIENPGFLEGYSVKYNLRYLASIRRDYDEPYIRELCDALALEFDSHTRMRAYSVGMRQKVGIIQSVMEHQNLVLLDEPSRGLDHESFIQFCHLMNHLKSQGVAVVIASHEDYPEMEIDRWLRLENGSITEVG